MVAAALESLGLHVEQDDEARFLIEAVRAIVRVIIDRSTPAVDERDIVLGGDFAFALADCITQATGEPFEPIAAFAAADLWRPGENKQRPGYIPRLIDRYNDPANRPTMNRIGQAFERWMEAPQAEAFDELEALYRSLRRARPAGLPVQ